MEVELGRDMSDFALFVATHELMHLRGATDRYDADGRSLVPDGLPRPELVPRFPQPCAEVMARNRLLGPGNEHPPEDLSELWVGPRTAREIGWLPRDLGGCRFLARALARLLAIVLLALTFGGRSSPRDFKSITDTHAGRKNRIRCFPRDQRWPVAH